MANVEEVFGIRSKLVLSYLERPEVDQRFLEALKTDHHVVVYGSSKQGKTSLRQKHLKERECIIVRCSPRMSLLSLYQSIVRQSGARIQTIETQTTTATAETKIAAGFRAFIPWVGGADTTVEGTAGAEAQGAFTTEFVAYNLEDAQAIAELLLAVGTKKWIVLENFHYLPVEAQQAIAFDLKTFHEVGIRFLILGIWREANLLVTHNSDLQGRIVEVPVEPWNVSDFTLVAKKGSEILAIEIDAAILSRFVSSAYGNVGLFQEFLRVFCTRSGIDQSTRTLRRLDSEQAFTDTISENLDARRNALLKNLQGIAAKSRVRRGEGEQPLLLPYYLVLVLLQQTTARLNEGIEKSQLLSLIRQVHHRDDKETVRIGDVTNLVSKLPSYQEDMTPILYYDGNSRRVRVVDSSIFFVLDNANRSDLAEEIPMPDFDDVQTA
jgi:hypothetical protein